MDSQSTGFLRDVSDLLEHGVETVDIDSLPEEEHDCPICQENYCPSDQPTRLPCSHIVGYDCLWTWLIEGHNNTCPVCRRKLYDENEAADAEDFQREEALLRTAVNRVATLLSTIQSARDHTLLAARPEEDAPENQSQDTAQPAQVRTTPPGDNEDAVDPPTGEGDSDEDDSEEDDADEVDPVDRLIAMSTRLEELLVDRSWAVGSRQCLITELSQQTPEDNVDRTTRDRDSEHSAALAPSAESPPAQNVASGWNPRERTSDLWSTEHWKHHQEAWTCRSAEEATNIVDSAWGLLQVLEPIIEEVNRTLPRDTKVNQIVRSAAAEMLRGYLEHPRPAIVVCEAMVVNIHLAIERQAPEYVSLSENWVRVFTQIIVNSLIIKEIDKGDVLPVA